MSFYSRFLSHPFVYTRIRPLVVGVDMTPSFENLRATEDDIVVDVGCGPGEALKHLRHVRALHGFDTDPVAISVARKLAGVRDNIRFEARQVTAQDLESIKPTRVMMNGLLHHLSDGEALDLLAMCAHLRTVLRIATQDVVLLPGEHLSNLLARLDRGRHVRSPEGYRALASRAGLTIASEKVVRSHPTRGLQLYFLMALEPSAEVRGGRRNGQ
jgi:SAM-dependent methyltransferase